MQTVTTIGFDIAKRYFPREGNLLLCPIRHLFELKPACTRAHA
jgi:hypothetical protein